MSGALGRDGRAGSAGSRVSAGLPDKVIKRPGAFGGRAQHQETEKIR